MGNQLFAKLKKCEFWLDRVFFLGHVISKERISIDSGEVEATINWSIPNSITEV